tara:strand:+ start:1801 stop:2625 length:825 start_codon:yes stop_codon:yes gene_type:complete
MTVTINENIEYLLDEAVELGRVRSDCPECGSGNTFSAMYLPTSMVVVYNCFDASCEVKGYKKVGLQKTNLKNGLFSKATDIPIAIQEEISTSNFLPILDNMKSCIAYLKKVQCYDLFIQDHINVKYDPQQDRIVFLVKDLESNKVINAVGRSLKPRSQPKWFKYAKTSADYKIGCGSIAVLVEDIPSACVVSKMKNVVGIAMCGTILSEILLHYLTRKNYEKVLVCLDKDAVLKSMMLCDTIKHKVKHSSVLFPEVDLKNMNPEELEELVFKNN